MSKIRKLFSADLSSVILCVVVLFVILAVSSKGFLSAYNILSNFQTVAIYGMIGFAQMATLSLGQMNLAVGSMGCLSSILMGMCMQEAGLPIIVCIIICIALGMLFGAIQGVLIAKTGINAFIVTLTLLSIYKGLANIITQGQSYQNLPAEFKGFNSINIGGAVPMCFVVMIIVCIAVFVLFKYTRLGQRMLASGANGKAAKYSGINYDNTIITGHMISGLLCAVAGILQVLRFGSAQISIGDDWMLTSFTVAILGGTLLSGGKVSVVGVILGSFVMVYINNALTLWGVSSFMVQIFTGLILILSYELDKARVNTINRQARIMAMKGDK